MSAYSWKTALPDLAASVRFWPTADMLPVKRHSKAYIEAGLRIFCGISFR